MHVRPVVVIAIFAAAAGAAVSRLTADRASPAFAVASPASVSTARSSRESLDARAATVGAALSPLANAAVGGEPSAASGSQRENVHQPHVPRAVVYVAGDVRHPGLYALAGSARVADALRAAGGPTVDADPIAVDLAAHVEDGEEIAVPARGTAEAASVATGDEIAPATRTRKHARRHRHRKHAHRKAPVASVADDGSAMALGAGSTTVAPVDVNAADAATLASLPGIGAGLADRIVAFRALNGSFASADELLDVGGMTARNVDRLLPFVTFGVPSSGTRSAR